MKGSFNLQNRGLTLVETIIFTMLISVLFTSVIQFFYSMHINNTKIVSDILNEYEK